MTEALDLPTKLRLITGAGIWETAAVSEIGLRAMHLSDGPVGVAWVGSRTSAMSPPTCPPPPPWVRPGMRTCWVGSAPFWPARLWRARVDIVLGPTLNLHRSPYGGRHFESYSEDPLLTGRLAAAYVKGLQDNGIAACPKHYVANDSETERMTLSAAIDDQTLREVYLAPFEKVVREAHPWAIMAAYNGVNGVPMTENSLLETPLRTEWGFDGVVISDWMAVYSTVASAVAGTDLAMPGPWAAWGEPLARAIADGAVPMIAIDTKVQHLLRLAGRVGALHGTPRSATPPAAPDAAASNAFVREAAAAGMVLLRNVSDVLPLTADATVALIGPGARDPRTQGGGSATVFTRDAVTPEQGLRAALGDRLRHADGLYVRDGLRPAPAADLIGAELEWLDAEDQVLASGPTPTATIVRNRDTAPAGSVAFRLRARIRLDVAGTWRVGGFGAGRLEVRVNDELPRTQQFSISPLDIHAVLLGPPELSCPVTLDAPGEVAVTVHFTWGEDLLFFRAGLGVQEPRLSAEQEFRRAVDLGADSDVAIVVVGTTEAIESEGYDRSDLRLPGRQDDLVAAVAAVNPRTVVVVNAGAPVLMPWRDDVAGILLTWFPGMECGHSLADVLTGDREPGGRLPTTWPAAEIGLPSTLPMDGILTYREGLDLGHRAYLREDRAPAYWFGAGGGYTNWDYSSLTVANSETGATATVVVANIGSRPGRTVVQIYLSRTGSAVPRPVRWLAGFTVVDAAAGERVTVHVPIERRAFEHWTGSGWAVEPGEFIACLGRSAGDIVTTTAVTVR